MARKREDFHEILVGILGSRYVYFQPPEDLKLHYPCIVYELTRKKPEHANNIVYLSKKAYKVTLIDSDPDSELCEPLENLTYSGFDDSYSADDLNHFVYTIYF